MIQDTLNSKGYQTQKQWTKEIFTKLGVFVDLVTFHSSLLNLFLCSPRPNLNKFTFDPQHD